MKSFFNWIYTDCIMSAHHFIVSKMRETMYWLAGLIIEWMESSKKPKSSLEDAIVFDDDDFYDIDFFQKGCERFLNWYDKKQLENDILSYRVKMGRYSGRTMAQILEKRGFENIVFQFDLSDYYVHKVCFLFFFFHMKFHWNFHTNNFQLD